MTPTSLVLARLVDAPDLVRRIHALPPPAFAALVRRIGVEDAGPIVALATTEQLVVAFDEELFGNPRPGERETFDATRFATWLEVLLEAGDAIAARRVSELSIDFVVHALGSLILVLDDEALRLQLADGGRAARRVDKAIESSLSEELDGYLLIARRHDGWDAALALILALDRDHRAFLERVLERCAAIAGALLDDLAELAGVLTETEAIADEVEGEREARRAAAGYVEPREAKAFLAHARGPFSPERDPLTRAYFRELAPIAPIAATIPEELRAVLAELEPDRLLPAPLSPVLAALGELSPTLHATRLAELTYLANVLIAGASIDGRRYTPHEAATEALATVERGLATLGGDPVHVLETTSCDVIFRRALAR